MILKFEDFINEKSIDDLLDEVGFDKKHVQSKKN